MKRVLLILIIFICFQNHGRTQVSSKPNIIFIIVDDLNDYVEGYGGHPQVHTPNIKYLAEHGYQFNNAFCNSPVCGPSRTSFLSGKDVKYTALYANNAYISEFRDNFTEEWNNEEVITLPEHLKNAGDYYTIGVNKVFHDPYNKDYDALIDDPCEKQLSWSRVVNFGDNNDLKAIMDDHSEGLTKFQWGRLPDEVETEIKDYRAVDSSIQILKEIHNGDIALCDSAFFLALGFALPHLDLYVAKSYFSENYLGDIYAEPFNLPYNSPLNNFPPNGLIMPPQPDPKWNDYLNLGTLGKSVAIGQSDIEEFFQHYADSLDVMPEINPDLTDSMRREIILESKRANAIMAYIAGIEFMDAQIGRLLDYLETVPATKENTIIIIAGDNGFSLGEKMHWMKRSFWETDVRIPFIIYDPKRTGGIINDNTVSLLDIFPTLCELTNTPYPLFADGSDYLDGKSILPLIEDPDLHIERPVLISWEAENNKECSCFPQYAVRSEKYKLIQYTSDGGDPANECFGDSSYTERELYEIGYQRETDPHEWHNLISDPDYEPLINYLNQWLPDSALYLQSTYKIILKNNPLPCLLTADDTLQLSFSLYDTLGELISPPANYQYIWTNNLTADTLFGPIAEFPLSDIPEAVFTANERIQFYIRMLDTSANIIAALDNKYFYLNSMISPNVSFNVVHGEDYLVYVNDISITGNYTNVWWDFGEGSLIYTDQPGPYSYQTPGSYTITCYLQYGNGCIKTFEQTIEVDVKDFFSDNTLFVFPNPTNSNINIFTNQYALNGIIYITNITGQIIQKIDLAANDYPYTHINVESYLPGIYFILHQKADSKETTSFIVVPKN